MEFTCRISPREFRDALRLKRKRLRLGVYLVLFVDMLLWGYWVALAIQGQTSRAATVFQQALILLIWPIIYLGFIEAFGFYSYKKNRNIQSKFVYRVDEAEFAYQSSSGGSGKTPWTSMSYWRGSKKVYILVFPSGVFLICPRSCLNSEQDDELRSILTKALPRK